MGRLTHVRDGDDSNIGSPTQPRSRRFRLKLLGFDGLARLGSTQLTPGIFKTLQWWARQLISTTGRWGLGRRVRPRAVHRRDAHPRRARAAVAGGGERRSGPRGYRAATTPLIVGRDVTTRDRNDRQQPFNLPSGQRSPDGRGAGAGHDLAPATLQGDLLRGLTFRSARSRRETRDPQPMHDALAEEPPESDGSSRERQIGPDGSMRRSCRARALSQTVDAQGAPSSATGSPCRARSAPARRAMACRAPTSSRPPTNTPVALNRLLSI